MSQVHRSRPDSLWVGLAALAWFTWHAAPGVTFEDSGELATAVSTLGVPHPPGYPLFVLLGRAWSAAGALLGWDVARSLNLLSAACGAGAVAALAALARRAGGGLGASLAAGCLPLASATFSAQAVVTEVYALAALLQALVILLALTAERPLGKTCLALGLALAAHPASVFYLPLVGVAARRERRREGRVRAGRAAAALAVGPLAFLYVPLAAAAEPALSWGEVTTVERFVDHVLRVQYRMGLEREWASQLAFLAEQSVGQWPAAVALALAASLALRRFAPRGLLAPLALTAAVTAAGLLLAVNYPLGEEAARVRLAGSYTPLVVALGALCVPGWVALERALATRITARGAALVVPLAVLGLALARGPRTLSGAYAQRASGEAEAYARETLDACPPDALLVVSRVGYSDVLGFPLLYLQAVGGHRPDVWVLDRELLVLAWYREQLARRRPEVAGALARLDATFEGNPRVQATPRDRRALTLGFFHELWSTTRRPVVFVARPGERLLAGRDVVAGPVLWHLVEDPAGVAAATDPPAGAWLPARVQDARDPWLRLLVELAVERDRARARRLRAQGELEAAERLERAR